MMRYRYSRGSILCALAVLFTLVACQGGSKPSPAGYFEVVVIADTASDPVSQEQAEAVIAIANDKLLDLTGFGLQLIEFVEDDRGGSIDSLVEQYMNSHEDNLPNGILVFSVGDDDRAKINRAYAQHISAPDGFRNTFVSPYLEDQYMYIAVLQFNYRYAACGYAGTDTIQSAVSIGDECRGVEGTACAEWEGMQVCKSVLEEFLDGHTPIDLAASPVIHEFMHSFGERGPDDHYGTPACNQAMSWPPDHFDFEESEYYNGFCPDVYAVFVDSYKP